MKSVPLSKLKASLSRYLTRVRAGEEVILTNRGVPVARLVALRPDDPNNAALRDLVRTGQIRPQHQPMPSEFLRRVSGAADPKGAVAAALATERENGR